MPFKLNLHPNKIKKVVEPVVKQAADIDVESIQKSLLQKNASQLDFAAQFQSLFDDISSAISKEFFNSQYKETPALKKLKDLQNQASKAKNSDELSLIRKQLEELTIKTESPKCIEAARQIGINALINKK